METTHDPLDPSERVEALIHIHKTLCDLAALPTSAELHCALEKAADHSLELLFAEAKPGR
jgi:hypothetical protein